QRRNQPMLRWLPGYNLHPLHDVRFRDLGIQITPLILPIEKNRSIRSSRNAGRRPVSQGAQNPGKFHGTLDKRTERRLRPQAVPIMLQSPNVLQLGENPIPLVSAPIPPAGLDSDTSLRPSLRESIYVECGHIKSVG